MAGSGVLVLIVFLLIFQLFLFIKTVIGPVEHLNSGTWSPAFLDVECTMPIGQKTFVWIGPGESGEREAELLKFESGQLVAADMIMRRPKALARKA